MLSLLTPAHTYVALLVVQAVHLVHHRLAKRHISFAEFISAVVLCFPPFLIQLPGFVFMSVHLLPDRRADRGQLMDSKAVARLELTRS